MIEIKDDIEDKLNDIGVGLSETQRLLKIMQAFFNDEENFKIEDIQTVFQILKSKIIEIKKDFNNIQVELRI